MLRALPALALLALLSLARAGEDDDRVLSQLCALHDPLICNMVPTLNSTVHGRVVFRPVFVDHDCFTNITASVKGLAPMTQQAIHIHNYGDLSLPNAKSLGGHFSGPAGLTYDHGLPGSAMRHWGDFGSLVVDARGEATYARVDRMISLPGIVGRGMVIHRDADKGREAQPSGGAGPRKAMCVIGYANPASLA